MKNLCIDAGNTKVKIALFTDGSLDWHEERMETDFDPNEFLSYSFDGVAISDVGEVFNYTKLSHAAKYFVHLDHSIPLPLTITYETPETLGRDRIAAVIGAQKRYDSACVVIDIGTCITLDFADKEKRFLGGNISPGLKMRLDAMHHFTDRLPQLEIDSPTNYIGKTTNQAMLNGAVNGIAHEIEGFISRLTQHYPELAVVFTGGGAEFFANRIKREIFVHPFLILEGLNEILYYNKKTIDRLVRY